MKKILDFHYFSCCPSFCQYSTFVRISSTKHLQWMRTSTHFWLTDIQWKLSQIDYTLWMGEHTNIQNHSPHADSQAEMTGLVAKSGMDFFSKIRQFISIC